MRWSLSGSVYRAGYSWWGAAMTFALVATAVLSWFTHDPNPAVGAVFGLVLSAPVPYVLARIAT